jgi:hypothetical protein
MSYQTQQVNMPIPGNNNSVGNSNNGPVASNENVMANNMQQNNLVRMSKNIPVDYNSEIPLEERWNCHQTRAPPPVPNGGLFGGPQAVGEYASIHVIPTTTNMIHHNLRSANPPPGATTQYPGTHRDKNNYVAMPGVFWYNDTHPVNTGPHAIKVVEHKN